jgi:hypothetical protein
MKICRGTVGMLRDLVRGVYFYNSGYLTKSVVPALKVSLLTEFSMKRISSVLTIQRVWRGVMTRKKLKGIVNDLFTKQRASVKIQRWLRNLPYSHRKLFMLNMIEVLQNFNSQTFYVPLQKYLAIATKLK